MKRYMFLKMGICLIFFSCAGATNTNRAVYNVDEYHSPISLVTNREGTTLYIAEATARQVAVLDIADNRVRDIIPLNDNPSGLVLSRDGSKLYVTCGSSKGTVEIIDLPNGVVVETIQVGHSPCSPVISPDGSKLYVCNRFSDTVSVLDLSMNEEVAKIPLMREPIAADITPDGKYLFVANHLPSARQIYEYAVDDGYMDIKGYSYNAQYTAKSVVLIVNTTDATLINSIEALVQLPDGSTGLRGICVSPDGRYVYVTHILARYLQPTTQITFGSINTNALSVIDVREQRLVNTVLLDDVDCGAANPWGVACTSDGRFICVTHAGTHEISVIDRLGFHTKLDHTVYGEIASDDSSTAYDVPNDLLFLAGLRRRVKLNGNGPRGLTIAGENVYVAEYFSDTIGVIDIAPDGNSQVRSLALGPNKQLTAARKGEMNFNDADLCFQQWQSCASCHPDGRTDALNWDLLNDGIGNPKNTKSLLLSHKTPPAMITGVRPKGEDAVRAGISHILFMEQPEEEASSIDTYLKSVKAVPSPYLVDGKLSKRAKRGRKIFKRAGCAECHPSPLYTDMKKYDVGTGRGNERNREFDTPTLVEIWRTAPYLYNGSADTIDQVVREYNRLDHHGLTSRLDYYEIGDLIEFILSL